MKTNSPLGIAADRLRAAALQSGDGDFLGSEDDLVAMLEVSRSTLKQAARLLEREGLLKVKRGVNGGYYGSRPTERTIQSVVNAYLATIDVSIDDVTSIASILWTEVVRRAAALQGNGFTTGLNAMIGRIARLDDEATPFRDVDNIEAESRSLLFEAIQCPYLELMMRINQSFGHRQDAALVREELFDHKLFIASWKRAKILELTAIVDGDQALATVAARNCRKIWSDRVAAGIRKPERDRAEIL